MIRSMLNWRSLLALVGIVIVTATIFYSQYLAKKIAADERQKVSLWVAASKAILSNPSMDLTLPNLIRNGQPMSFDGPQEVSDPQCRLEAHDRSLALVRGSGPAPAHLDHGS